MKSVDTTNNVAHFLKTFGNVAGVPPSTVFTVLTTLFVFGLGVVTNWIINKLKERNQRINYRNTINLLLSKLAQDLKIQNLVIVKSLQRISILNNKTLAVQIQTLSSLYFLNKMDYSLFIKYYVRGCNKKLKIKAASKLFALLGYANIFESDTEEKLESWMSSIRPYQEIYIKNIALIEKFLKDLPQLQVIDYDFKNGCIQISKSWQKNYANTNFDNSYNNLIIPLKRLLEKFPMEPSSNQVADLVEECHRTFCDISHIDRLITEHLQNFAYATKKAYRQLNTILRIYKYNSPIFKQSKKQLR